MYQTWGERAHIFKKLYKWGHPNVLSPFPAIVNLWTKHVNFKADAADLDIDRFCYEWYRWASNGPNNGKKRVRRQKPKLLFFNGLVGMLPHCYPTGKQIYMSNH